MASSVNFQFLISMLIIMLAYFFKRLGLVKESDGEGVSRIIFNITLPALVITTFSTIKVDTTLLMVPVICAVFGAIMTAVALFAFRKEERKVKGLMSMLVPAFNIGLFAYPLVDSLWGQEGLKYIGMFDMGNSIIVFGVCYVTASIYSTNDSVIDLKVLLKRVAYSIPLMSYVITLSVNLAGLHFPNVVLEVTKVISKANSPLSLLLLGIYLSFTFEFEHLAKMGKVLLLRYGIGIVTGAILYFVLPFEPLLKYILMIGLALPISMSVIPYSVQFDYDKKFAGTLNNMTIIISFLYIWAIAAFVIH